HPEHPRGQANRRVQPRPAHARLHLHRRHRRGRGPDPGPGPGPGPRLRPAGPQSGLVERAVAGLQHRQPPAGRAAALHRGAGGMPGPQGRAQPAADAAGRRARHLRRRQRPGARYRLPAVHPDRDRGAQLRGLVPGLPQDLSAPAGDSPADVRARGVPAFVCVSETHPGDPPMRTLRLVAAILFLSVLAACATGARQSSAPPPPVPTLVDDYLIGVDDEVQVSVWRNPELGITVPVRPDGKISVPLVGDVVAGGRTPNEVAADIQEKLGAYVRDPQVAVILTQLRSHEYLSRVRVTGAVRQPVSIPYRQGMTVLDAVLAAGGVTEFAAPD